MKITDGIIPSAQKIIIYGPEGIGKSTFASHAPNALFIDTEGSTKQLDVRRLPTPESWTMLMDEVAHVRDNPSLCKTLVIDTADWAEALCAQHLMATNKWQSIESPGYGKGYVILAEEFGRLLNRLSEVVDRGVNVLMTAHAQMRKFEQPDELGGYDRWELKLQKKTAPMVKEWADMVLFANYKTFVVNVDGQGAAKGKNKAQGGQRVMYTSHHPCWDAKNRVGLDPELPFDFNFIGGFLDAAEAALAESPVTPFPAPQAMPEPVPKAEPTQEVKPVSERPEGIPDALWQLMQKDQVTVEMLRYTVFKRGYYPADTPISAYDPDFIQGVLIGAWPQVSQMAQDIKHELPF